MPRSSQFSLRFPTNKVQIYAARYEVDERERHILNEIAPSIRSRGYITKPDLLEVCFWKSPRSKNWCDDNDEDFVQSVTAVALSTPSESLRIEALTLLSGIAWPTASVLLHLGH